MSTISGEQERLSKLMRFAKCKTRIRWLSARSNATAPHGDADSAE